MFLCLTDISKTNNSLKTLQKSVQRQVGKLKY